MTKNIEVEFRAALDDNKYEEMLDFFNKNGKLVMAGERVTTKYSPPDLRIREDWNGKTLMLKIGDVNNTEREEYEVGINDSTEIKKIIENLGFYLIHSWRTKRKKFEFKDFYICIDDIPGFMKTMEIERKCLAEEVNLCKQQIQELFDSLGLKPLIRIGSIGKFADMARDSMLGKSTFKIKERNT